MRIGSLFSGIGGLVSTAGSLRVASLVLNPGWVTYLMGFPGDKVDLLLREKDRLAPTTWRR